MEERRGWMKGTGEGGEKRQMEERREGLEEDGVNSLQCYQCKTLKG